MNASAELRFDFSSHPTRRGSAGIRAGLATFLIVIALGMGVAAPAVAVPSYTYIGKWIVGDGPLWTTNPPAYSGQTAAALLFGGAPTDYAISTIDSDPSHIDFRTFLDGYGNTQYLMNPAPMDYSLSSNGGGYDMFPSFSAFVLDHTCSNRYTNLSAPCSGNGTQYVNYAFRITEPASVPEPPMLLLIAATLVGIAFRRR
jgi:hypothetical protein